MTEKCFLEAELKTAEEKVKEIKEKLKQRNNPVVELLEEDGCKVLESSEQGYGSLFTRLVKEDDLSGITGKIYRETEYVIYAFQKISLGQTGEYRIWWKKVGDFNK